MRDFIKKPVVIVALLVAVLGGGAVLSANPAQPATPPAKTAAKVVKKKPSQTTPAPQAVAPASVATPVSVNKPAPKPVSPPAPVKPTRPCLAPNGFEAGTNSVRSAHGLATMCTSPGLRQAAYARANYMCQTNTFSHAGFYAGQLNAYYSAPTGMTGENISAGIYSGDGQVVQELVNSPEHYANMVNPGYTEQGAASIMCDPPYCTAIGICQTPVPVQINVNDFGG